MSDSIKSKLLDAVTATGASAALKLGVARSTFSLQVIFTGAPTVVVVDIEGSHDNGVTRGVVASWKTADGRVSGDIISVSSIPLDNVRLNLSTLTGGTAPTVTAILIADEI